MIPVIDLFAGPGGLGEGFMSVKSDGVSVFDIKLSIEKDTYAHKTLTLRSFYRQFDKKGKNPPHEYYKVLCEVDLNKREELMELMLDKYPEGKVAREEARLIELGSTNWPSEKVDKLIHERLGSHTEWVLIGGPPCQAYSNAGRSRVGGIDIDDHRVYLYREYLRIIEKHNPAVFVMENVKGLLSAKVGEDRVFDWIKHDLQLDGLYKIYSFVKPVKNDRDFLIKAEEYGVPQKRHRVILLGIRYDLKHNNQYLNPVTEQVSLKSIIGKLPKIRSALNRAFVDYDEVARYRNGKPKRIYRNIEDSDAEWCKVISEQIEILKTWGEIPVNGVYDGPQVFKFGIGAEFIPYEDTIDNNHPLKDWYLDDNLKGITNHESRAHLTQDLMRYMFAGLYVEKYQEFPRLKDYAKHNADLIPDHENVESGKFTDRFRVQVADKPATTVTSHISKDGHYFIHYDPAQCRSLTVREAARIQTFPDNYLLCGSRTAQFHQVGNAVPPYLACQLAQIVAEIFNKKNRY